MAEPPRRLAEELPEKAVDVNRLVWLAAGLAGASLMLIGCTQGHTENARNGDDDQPARLVTVEGSQLKGVVLTARATERLGIKSEPVREVPAPGATTNETAVPVAALIYDKNGEVWVYTSTQPHRYVRQRVTVERIQGDLAILESGPAAGTLVITVGAAELLGTEYGVEGQ